MRNTRREKLNNNPEASPKKKEREAMKYRLTCNRGEFFLYNIKWSDKCPWFRCKGKKRLRSYIEHAGINPNKVDGYDKALRERLYHRIPRIEV